LHVVKGGFLVMHDYSSLWWDGVEKAVDEFFAVKPEKVIPIPDKSGTAVIRKIG
jgi:O-methyltransferase